MNSKAVYIFLLLSGLFSQLFAQVQPSLEVLVQDQRSKVVPGIRVSIQNSDYQITNKQGKFNFTPETALHMPVRAELEDEHWEVLRVEYYEDASRLQVLVNRLIGSDEIVSVLVHDSLGHPMANAVLSLGNTPFRADGNGRISLSSPLPANASIILPENLRLQAKNFNAQEHLLSLVLVEKSNQSPSSAAVLEPDVLVKAYEEDFERITLQIESDRAIYEQKNEEIRMEILKIQDKLLNEDEITEPQREELRGYLRGLEKSLDENSQAIRISEERTREALNKLKGMLMAKDSLNRVALGHIQRIESEKAAVEATFKEKMLVFAAITFSLLMVLGIVYFFAFKYRKQKAWLKEVNKMLKLAQGELTSSVRELRQKKEQIEDHNQQLELFVYKASHDIKGPLRSIMGLSQIGINDVKDSTAIEYFQHIYKSTRRLDNLLMDLLKLTKVKQAEVEPELINLPAMLEEIVQSFSNIRHFDLVKTEIDIQEGLELVTDEKLLYSVLQNFVENSIKYCDPYKTQPMLQIKVEQNEAQTTFTFRDNGLGIAAEQLPKIFDMFYKIDPSSDGTGLGLHIVKITIDKLRGKLRVRSRVREGSTFILTLPR